MLVLSRKLNEKIQIGDNVTIKVVRIRGDEIRLGIEAPRSVRVIRAELPPLPSVAAEFPRADGLPHESGAVSGQAVSGQAVGGTQPDSDVRLEGKSQVAAGAQQPAGKDAERSEASNVCTHHRFSSRDRGVSEPPLVRARRTLRDFVIANR